jgi:RNA-directed DNA polymerase
VQKFERYLEENIFELRQELLDCHYKHGSYKPFSIHDPKHRQIHKATVKDRLIHQAIVDCIEPLFEQYFIYDSYSCRIGKGTHAAVKRLRNFLRTASANNTQPVYALKCDIKQFFASVDHQILKRLIRQQVHDQKILTVIDEIINGFQTSPGLGIPLGNVTSQLFANIYMHELDFFIKHTMRTKYYMRYCDDFVILGTDRQELLAQVQSISEFLNKKLKITLHPNKVTVRKWSEGIDFVGYIIKPNCILIRAKTKKRMLVRLSEKNLSSYMGVCSHANSYYLRQELLTRVWLQEAQKHST